MHSRHTKRFADDVTNDAVEGDAAGAEDADIDTGEDADINTGEDANIDTGDDANDDENECDGNDDEKDDVVDCLSAEISGCMEVSAAEQDNKMEDSEVASPCTFDAGTRFVRSAVANNE